MMVYKGNNLFDVHLGHKVIELSSDEIEQIVVMAHKSNVKASRRNKHFNFDLGCGLTEKRASRASNEVADISKDGTNGG
jgi:hypothetical protein